MTSGSLASCAEDGPGFGNYKENRMDYSGPFSDSF